MHGLHGNPILRVLLANGRKQVDRPLGPVLRGRHVDVLHAKLRKLAYVGFVACLELRSHVHDETLLLRSLDSAPVRPERRRAEHRFGPRECQPAAGDRRPMPGRLVDPNVDVT